VVAILLALCGFEALRNALEDQHQQSSAPLGSIPFDADVARCAVS
jgi:hypothetical protein